MNTFVQGFNRWFGYTMIVLAMIGKVMIVLATVTCLVFAVLQVVLVSAWGKAIMLVAWASGFILAVLAILHMENRSR